MGKANRTKRSDPEKQVRKQELQRQAALAKKKSARNSLIALVCVAIVVVLIGATLVNNALTSSGIYLRNTVSVTSENFELDNAMVSYYFNTVYQEFLNQAGSYISYYGLDTSLPLKTQSCIMLSNGTWYDYFMDNAKISMRQTLVFAEEAKAQGYALTDEDYADIDEAMAMLDSAAKENGVSTSYYIHAMYGSGVSKNDIRRVLELNQLSNKYYNELIVTYNFTSDDYNTYYSENPLKLLQVDYLEMSLSTLDGMLEGDITADTVDAFAVRLAAAQSREEFETIAFEYLRNNAYKDDKNTTDETINKEIDGFLKENVTYVEEDAVSEWAFADDAAVGSTFIDKSEDGKTSYVYYLLATPAIDEDVRMNVRHILITAENAGSLDAAKEEATRILEEWKNGEATEESFAALAEKYSDDLGSANNGGLYENIAQDEVVESFGTWLYDEANGAGATGLVESDYGCHVMYKIGEGLKNWEYTVDVTLKNDAYKADYEELEAKHEVNFDNAKLNKFDA